MTFIDYVLWLLPVTCAVLINFSRKLVNNVILLSVFSLSVAGLFLRMAAPDVAITEAAIGAAISTIYFLAAIRISGDYKEDKNKADKFPAIVVLFSLVMVMLSIVSIMPEYGDATSPANSHVGQYYIENTKYDTGIPNAVTSTLASYRGFDTLGETYVIFVAGLAVMLILPTLKKKKDEVKRGAK